MLPGLGYETALSFWNDIDQNKEKTSLLISVYRFWEIENSIRTEIRKIPWTGKTSGFSLLKDRAPEYRGPRAMPPGSGISQKEPRAPGKPKRPRIPGPRYQPGPGSFSCARTLGSLQSPHEKNSPFSRDRQIISRTGGLSTEAPGAARNGPPKIFPEKPGSPPREGYWSHTKRTWFHAWPHIGSDHIHKPRGAKNTLAYFPHPGARPLGEILLASRKKTPTLDQLRGGACT